MENDPGQAHGKEFKLPNYELTYILRPVEEANLSAANTRILNLLNAGGGTLVARNDWGRRRLAYPIRKFTDGYYTTLYIALPPTAVRNLERSLKLTEDVLRYMVVRVEEHTLPAAPPAPAAPTTTAEPAAAAPAPAAPAPPTPAAPAPEMAAPAQPPAPEANASPAPAPVTEGS